jgi:hypothetical protein
MIKERQKIIKERHKRIKERKAERKIFRLTQRSAKVNNVRLPKSCLGPSFKL